MNCCRTANETFTGTDSFFTKLSRRHLKKFRRKGLANEQRMLREGIGSVGISEASILEIGSGIGALHLTLLQDGASRATGIDIAEGMIATSRMLSQELKLGDRVTYHQGDFLRCSSEMQMADIILLDKVVCCYEDVDTLVEKSLALSDRIYAVSMPRSRWWLKMLISIPVILGTTFRWSFHPYWHDWNRIQLRIQSSGFIQRYSNHTMLWEVCVYERALDARLS